MAIIAYLEERFPRRRCCRRDPWLRARARQLAEMVNAGIQPLPEPDRRSTAAGGGVDANEWARHFIARGLAALEAAARRTAGDVPGRRRADVADLYLIRSSTTPAAGPSTSRRSRRCCGIESACAGLPAFPAAHADAQSDAVSRVTRPTDCMRRGDHEANGCPLLAALVCPRAGRFACGARPIPLPRRRRARTELATRSG